MKRADLTGRRFGRLTVVSYAAAVKGRAMWHCVCDCGARRTVTGHNLGNGHTQSCGCLSREKSAARLRTHGGSREGGKVKRLHYIWTGMRQRCCNPNSPAFCHYGGRGITVCAEWHNYEAFRAWALANGYHDALELDRVDNDGPYSPENCRWATRTVQMRNTRRARLLTFCGETKHLAEWAEELGIRASTIKDRLAAGWPVERALIAPVIEKVTA